MSAAFKFVNADAGYRTKVLGMNKVKAIIFGYENRYWSMIFLCCE